MSLPNKNLEEGARRQCLHAVERIAKTKCSNSEQVCQDALAIAKMLMVIEQYVVWTSDTTQARYKELVNELGDAMTNQHSTVDLDDLADRVGRIVAKILQRTEPAESVTPDERLRYTQRFHVFEEHVQHIIQVIPTLQDRVSDTRLLELAGEANKLENLICNARHHLEAAHPNKKMLKKIFPVLEKRIAQLESCSLWDTLVDTIAPLVNKRYELRCPIRRGSRSTAA